MISSSLCRPPIRAGSAVVTEGRLAFRPPLPLSVGPGALLPFFLPPESQAAFRRAEPPSALRLAFSFDGIDEIERTIPCRSAECEVGNGIIG